MRNTKVVDDAGEPSVVLGLLSALLIGMGFTDPQVHVPTKEEAYLMSLDNVHIGVPCVTCSTGTVKKFECKSAWNSLMEVFRLLRFDEVNYLGFNLSNDDTDKTSMFLWFSIHLNPLVTKIEHAKVLFGATSEVLGRPLFTEYMFVPTVKPGIRLMRQALEFMGKVLCEVIASYMGNFEGLIHDLVNLVVIDCRDADLEMGGERVTIYDEDAGARNLKKMSQGAKGFLNFYDHPGKSILNPPGEFTLETCSHEQKAYAFGMIADELHRRRQVVLYIKQHCYYDDTDYGISENTGQLVYDCMLRIREQHPVKLSQELVVAKYIGLCGEVCLKLTVGWEKQW
jgi:hypothetical protein